MSSSTKRTAVLLDQHPLWLDAVEGVLTPVGVQVIHKTTEPADALDRIRRDHPDLFVTEFEMPSAEMDGITCIRLAIEAVPELRAVVLSARAAPQQVNAAFAVGAVAYVVKNAHPEDLALVVRQTFESSVYLASSPGATAVPRLPTPENACGLTTRELEILRLVSQGHSNSQLARMLWVTEQTIKFHLSNIYRKLDVANRTEAAHWAQVNGLLGLSEYSVPVHAA